MKRALIILSIISLFLSSCTYEMTQAELFDMTKSGSVLILNKYFFQLRLPNNEVLYFTGLDSDGDLDNVTNDVNEIRKNCAIMSGTGFFVDDKGMILTNRHVAQPYIEESDIKTGYRNLLHSIGLYYEYLKEQVSDKYDELENSKSECVYFDGYNYYQDTEKLNNIQSQQEELTSTYQEILEMISTVRELDDSRSLKISSVCEIGIAYNDTHVTGEKDFLEKNPCVIIKTSEKQDVDLALIQLKDKHTPEEAYIFAAKEEPAPLEMGQQLYMIGYNAGPTLATTKSGIQVQMTSGKVTQLSDGQRILYDIATVQGSSGSPIIDMYGNLVGVNFAKLNGSDNFNFGIPIERVKEFMKW